MRYAFFILFILSGGSTACQTLGGNTVFNFLNLPNSSIITGMGEVNSAFPANDISVAWQQPALLNKNMHAQINTTFNQYYAGIQAYNFSAGYHQPKINTSFFYGIHFINYGDAVETDAAGNEIGDFRANDWVMQVGASRKYLEKWQYGLAIKFISSNYGLYRSNGVAADVGLHYYDSANQFSAGLVAKNMGTQLSVYQGTGKQDIPFDLQAGVFKKLAEAPFGFSLNLHHLHQFDIRYNDSLYNRENGWNNDGNNFFLDKLFRHVVASMHIFFGNHVEASIGYNHLRRRELNIGRDGNGLNGFSVGVGIKGTKFRFQYAHARYQNNSGYHQAGLTVYMDKLIRLGF